MKKIILVPAMLGVMGIGGVMAIAFEKSSSANNDKLLTFEEIEQKALAVVKGDVKDIDLESNGFKSYYEVEIITDEFEYDLKLDAISGELLKKKKEPLDYEDIKSEKTLTNATTTNDKFLTIEEIKKKALAVVNGTITDIELEKNGNTGYYEVEIQTADAEYDLKLDAISGELLHQEKETKQKPNVKNEKTTTVNNEKTSTNTQTSSNEKKSTNSTILTVEEIKQKALAIVNGTITDIEFEKKGNKSYYEVEVVTSDAEYDLKLDATSGALLEKEKEALDYDDDNDDWDDFEDDERDDD